MQQPPPQHNPVHSEQAFVEILMKEPHGDWYNLGLVLGLPEPELKQINYIFKGRQACLKRLFKCLKKNKLTGILTWESIADALSSPPMKCFALAKEVVERYLNQYLMLYVPADVYTADRQCFAFLCDLLGNDWTLIFDKVGFVKVSDILELNDRPDFREKDIRRVVAGHPILTLAEGPPLKIRINGGHKGSAELKEIVKNIQKEKRLYEYLLCLCRNGVFEKELHFNSDGSVNISDILLLESVQFEQEDIKNAIKYNKKDDIVLLEKMPNSFSIKPTMGPYKNGPVQYPRESAIYDKLLDICQYKEYPPSYLDYDEEGYVAVSDVLPILQEYNATEADVQQVVEKCSRHSLSLKRELGRLMIKANWGHCRKVVFHDSMVRSPLDVPPFIVCTVTRRYWVQIKEDGLKAVGTQKTIVFSYSDKELSDEEEFWEHYGHHNVVIVLDLEKALQDSLEFVKIPPEKLICLNQTVGVKYFKKVVT